MTFDLLFFNELFLVAKQTGWKWGPGEDGTNGDKRFELIRGIDFTDGSVTVNGKQYHLDDGDVVEVM